MPKPLRTQFIVADGARARWVRRSDQADDFVTTREMKAEPHQAGHPQGVAFESSTGRGFNIEEGAGAVREHRERFAREVADAVNVQAADGSVERLVIVAPARTLNAIRGRLDAVTDAKVRRTLAKDLSKTPDHRLGTWLRPLEVD